VSGDPVKSVKVTCLTWTAVFLVLAGVSGWLVHRRAPYPGAALAGGAVGGVILLSVMSWLRAIPVRIAEWLRIARAQFGGEPRDGQRVAIIGTLRGNGELTAPFSRERCVYYTYEVIATDITDGESSDRKAYEGFAMVPLSIEHGTQRTRILGRPELPWLKTQWRRNRTAEANAKLYLESTHFTPPPARTAAEPDFSQAEGRVHFDYSTEPLETNMGACRLEEKLLAAGTNVCALGQYRADRHALAAPVTLRFGTSFGMAAAFRIVYAGIGAAIFTAIALIAAAVFCANYPLEIAEQLHPEWKVAWWEVDLDRLVDQHLRRRMAAAGMLDGGGFYLQELCDGCAKGRLDLGGRSIELKHAAYVGSKTVHLSASPGDRDGVRLIAGKRVVLTVDGKSAAVPAGWLQPNDIVTALGSQGNYEGRVTAIDPNGGIRCRVSFNAHVNADDWLPAR
jgi:hypothetical protein